MKYFTSIGKDYVSHWTPEKALLELYINGKDRELESPKSKFSMEYLEDSGAVFSNESSFLELKHLVMGVSKKSEIQVGEFGEGLKVAILTLLREGAEVEIKNSEDKWAFSFEEHPEFKAEVLTIEVSKKCYKGNSTLSISVKISPEIFSRVYELLVPEDEEMIRVDTEAGSLLYSEKNGYRPGTLYCEYFKVKSSHTYGFSYIFPRDTLAPSRERDSFSVSEQLWINKIWRASLILLKGTELYFKLLYMERWRYQSMFRIEGAVSLISKEEVKKIIEMREKEFGKKLFPEIDSLTTSLVYDSDKMLKFYPDDIWITLIKEYGLFDNFKKERDEKVKTWKEEVLQLKALIETIGDRSLMSTAIDMLYSINSKMFLLENEVALLKEKSELNLE